MEKPRFPPPPSCQDIVFRLWKKNGLDRFAKLEGLKSKYSLQQIRWSFFSRYLQVRYYLSKNLHAVNTSFLENLLSQTIQLAAKVDSARNNANAKFIETILKFWISMDIPTLDDWYKEVLRTLPLEKLTYTIHDNA